MRKIFETTVCAAAMMLLLGAIPSTAQETAAQKARYPQRDTSTPGFGPESIRATFTVQPGQSVQDAVDRARPGDTIQIRPGVYHEEVTIDFDDIRLIGVIENGERPVFDGHDEM